MDLHFDENNVFQFAQGRKLGIILNKPLSSDFCQAARNSIARITLDVTDGVDLNFLKILKKLQIPYELFVKDSSKLQSLRLENMDEEISLFERKTKKDLDSSAVICNNAIMKSSKILISNGKRFASKAHWVLNKEISSEYQEVIDNSDFWEDLDYYIIYNKENKNAKGKTKGK